MPPLPQTSNPLPRLITYYQTHHDPAGKHISILPLITQPGIAITHVILAAIHVNEDPLHLTLNDHPPDHSRFQTLWAELRILQASGVRVMGMLGGAAQGSYQRLDGPPDDFERYYGPVRDLVRERGLDGLDLDVEEEMSLAGIIRLIDRLRGDFGKDFIITLAPVAYSLLDFTKNLSGFDYEALEVMRGKDIAWYNTQFYCGWGDMSNPLMYDFIIRKGWLPEKIVVGLVTNPENGGGFIPFDPLTMVMTVLRGRYDRFGGVMGWEYFNGLPGGKERPWEWAKTMTSLLGRHTAELNVPVKAAVQTVVEVDADAKGNKAVIDVPREFEYFSDEAED
ncbi:chitinase [Paramyrothecium foliicola]|nr:chitinase [Paramyrothecium foliicola]